MESVGVRKETENSTERSPQGTNGEAAAGTVLGGNLAPENTDSRQFQEHAPRRPPRTKLSITGSLLGVLRDLWNDIAGRRTYKRYLEHSDRLRRIAGQVFLLGNVGFGLIYIVWFSSVINWDVWYVSVPFVFAEIAGLLTSTFFAIIIWYPRYHRPEGLSWNHTPTVDVFIATCGEPITVLQHTIAAANQLRYRRKKVYLLDDAGSPAVKALTERSGCHYIARPEHSHAKAGNLNYGLAHTDGEFVLVLDADQIADPDILERLINYFKFPDVGFVQSAQRFQLPPGDPFGNSDELFYKVMQPGKDNDNSAFSCGSGVIYRRAALETIGGFSTWNLVEDVHTSMKLHAKGWKSIYHNHALTTGTAPTDICGVYKQRQQWATDSLRLIFWDNPFRYPGLTLKQKFQYFQVGFVYLISAFVMPIYFLIPSWSLLTGHFLARAPVVDYALFRGVYFLFTLLALVILEHPADSTKPYKIWAGLFPVFIKAAFTALRSKSKKPRYVVNGKLPNKLEPARRLESILPQLAIILLTFISIVYSLHLKTLPTALLVVNGLWGCWVIWSLSGICYAALKRNDIPQNSTA